jgi:hypothetical protein
MRVMLLLIIVIISLLLQVMRRYLEDMDNEDMAIFHCMVVPCNSHEFFTSHEIEEGAGQSIDSKPSV